MGKIPDVHVEPSEDPYTGLPTVPRLTTGRLPPGPMAKIVCGEGSWHPAVLRSHTTQMPGLEGVPSPSRIVPVPEIWISRPAEELTPPGKNPIAADVCTMMIPAVCDTI